MNEHTHRLSFCQVTYWNGNSAASSDETWTHCKVSPLGMYTAGEKTFQNSESDIYARDSLIRFLEKAYEHGRSDAKREIREVLGVKEPRT